MTPKKILRIFGIAAIALTGLTSRSFSQIVTWAPNYTIGTTTGNYDFSYSTIPDPLVEVSLPTVGSGSLTYQWLYSLSPLSGFTANFNQPGAPYITGSSTQPILTFSQPLTQTTYFLRQAISTVLIQFPILGSGPGLLTINSNTVKISVVSLSWQDINYERENDILTTGITTYQAIDQLPIGQKLQVTSFKDGIGRPTQTVVRETATPTQPNGVWGDNVAFHQYDAVGREPKQYLSYSFYNFTGPTQGQYKASPVTDQNQYIGNEYSDNAGYSYINYEPTPLGRVATINDPGYAWQTGRPKMITYVGNPVQDAVPILSVDYVQGDAPVMMGYYQLNALHKAVYTDENDHAVIEYTNLAGQLILRKVQIDGSALLSDAGYACTYSVYDDFGLLCYQIQPEGVKYLDANNWSFAGTAGQAVLAEQCFQYVHDDKGRMIWKKTPGAAPLAMLYDIRDRLVFEQDGNQAAMSTPQWTATLYDGLDRTVMTALYNTTETMSNLQNDIAGAVTVTTASVTNPGQPLVNQVVTTRQPGVTQYTAQNSIVFASEGNGGFQTSAGDEIVAQIITTAASPSYTVTSTVLGNPITAANLANPAVTTVLKYFFYDDYSFSTARPFDNNFTNAQAYGNTDPNVMPIVSSLRTIDMSTGSLTRVLGTSIFLGATRYFDEKGRQIQTLEDNIKSGTDISTTQYHFDGHVLSTCNIHSAPGTDYAAPFITLTKFIFDKLSRVISIQKQFGSNPFRTIANYDLDDIGRVKTRHLDPNYNNPNSGAPDLESLNYSFNIHNQRTGINKDYALKTPATYNKWAHFFGLYQGFDNQDLVFNAAQLDGQVGGQLWSTQGDDAQRKYDYTYDGGNRLTNAYYHEQQHPGDGWSNGQMDFSVSGTSGYITYDYNGNLQTLLQKGVIPGTSTPVTIDDLRYTYGSYSNRLQSVTDLMPNTAVNGQFGDFKDGTNAAGIPDYVYDNNGNLVIDLNKNVQSLNNGAAGTNGISYNFLDKPEQIRIVGKGTIKIVYDADGDKLQRVFIPESGSAATITSYIGAFVYQETATLALSSPAPFSGSSPALSTINFGEGRIRVMTPGSQNNGLDGFAENGNFPLPNGKMGALDYFITDYQENVRMILTEETHSAINTCTMETVSGRPAAEDPVFGQPGAGNEVEATRYPTPPAWQSVNNSASVSRLGNIAGHTIGPNTLQKVMAGDMITASAQYYYQGPATNGSTNIVSNILSSLLGAIGANAGASTLVHGSAPAITGQLNGTSGFLQAVQPPGVGGSTPQAYLTILFFDERFNFIAAADGGVAQQQVATNWTSGTPPLGLTNVRAPRNGYAFIYVSNRSDQDVYFDNLAVGITAGNIIEEDHYYAYGLKIAAISSKKLGDAGEGTLKNSYLYNDKELFDDGDLDWYDYGFRNYDPQIGRFTQLDPLTDEYPELTPFQYASCDPITNIDLDGLEGMAVAFDFLGLLAPATVVPTAAQLAAHSALTVAAKVAPKALTGAAHILTASGARPKAQPKTITRNVADPPAIVDKSGFGQNHDPGPNVKGGGGFHWWQIRHAVIWGSGDGTDAPAGKADPDEPVGSIDFGAVQDIFGLVLFYGQRPSLRAPTPGKDIDFTFHLLDLSQTPTGTGPTKPVPPVTHSTPAKVDSPAVSRGPTEVHLYEDRTPAGKDTMDFYYEHDGTVTGTGLDTFFYHRTK